MESVGTTQTQQRSEATHRRQFLLAGGASIAGIGLFADRHGLGALAEPLQEVKEPEKSLFEQLAFFDAEEKGHLAKFLAKYNSYGWVFGEWPASAFVEVLDNQKQAEEYVKKLCEEREKYLRYRDSLPRAERIQFVLERVKRELNFYGWQLQEQTLVMVRDGTPPPANVTWGETLEYSAGCVRRHFEGCDKAFCAEVIGLYLRDVLPGERAEQEAREADEKARDKLVEAVCEKTPAEIEAIAEQIMLAA